MAKLGAQRLQSTLDDIAGLASGDPRQRALLAVSLDGWLPYEDAIHAQDPSLPTLGFSLGPVPGGRAWLVPGGQVLTVPDDPSFPARLRLLADDDVDSERLAGRLRDAVITAYIGGIALADLVGPPVPVVVADLLQVVWGLDVPGRVAILEALAGAMRPAEGWDQVAIRLKGGFEQGVSDRSSPVRVVAARALVRMAAGLGPTMPMADPTRIVGVLFLVPYRDVRVATLTALDALDPALLARMVPVIEPHLHTAAADPDPETRRLVAALELRLVGRPEADALAADLASAEGRVRADALRQLGDGPVELADAFLARILEVTGDPDADVRLAAAEVLVPMLARVPDANRVRILAVLLASPDARLGRLALDYLLANPVLDLETERSVRGALDGPEVNRGLAAGLLCGALERAPGEAAVEGFLSLLRHRDPVVRQATLRSLTARPPESAAVRDNLFNGLVEHLRDPEPTLRVEAARAVVALGYPQAPELVGQLALDPDAVARRGALTVLREVGDAPLLRHAEQVAGHVDTLLSLPAPGDGDARVRWLGALAAVSQEPHPRALDLLVTVLASIPPDTADPFLRQATHDLDERLMARAQSPIDHLALCRRLLEPPDRQPDHASRLAALRAADDPAVLDLLWALYTELDGPASEAGRRGLATLAGQAKSAAVKAELEAILHRTTDPARCDVLRTLLAGA